MAIAAMQVTTMKAAEVSGPGENFQIVEREIPSPVRARSESRRGVRRLP